MLQCHDAPVHKVRSVKTFARAGVEKLDLPAQSPGLHDAEHPGDELEC